MELKINKICKQNYLLYKISILNTQKKYLKLKKQEISTSKLYTRHITHVLGHYKFLNVTMI